MSDEKRARRRAAKREAIQRAARSLFEERGYLGSKVEEIADLCEISIGAIYLHFRSKDDLLVSLLAEPADPPGRAEEDALLRLAADDCQELSDESREAAALFWGVVRGSECWIGERIRARASTR